MSTGWSPLFIEIALQATMSSYCTLSTVTSLYPSSVSRSPALTEVTVPVPLPPSEFVESEFARLTLGGIGIVGAGEARDEAAVGAEGGCSDEDRAIGTEAEVEA